jgi:Tol biopolymer transport system component
VSAKLLRKGEIVKNFRPISKVTAAAAVLTGFLLTPLSVWAQLPRDPVERAKVVAQIFEANARQLTLFDRSGKEISRIGSKDMYQQPVLSPDGKRVAVIKGDIDKETNDLWIVDAATGKGTQLTTSQAREGSNAPMWSPDGTQVAYVALRNGSFNLYRKPADGSGTEELLYQHAGSPITLTDWSADGRYLLFSSNDLSGGILYALPLSGDRKPIPFLKSADQIRTPRVSPDGRFVAYPSAPTGGRAEVYVRAFDPSMSATDSPTGRWQISDQGTIGMVSWRRDGKELLYLAPDRSIMAVDVNTTGAFTAGKPKQLFRSSEATPIAPGLTGFSRDAERILLAVPPPQLRQLTVFDRTGKVVSTVGSPGLFVQPGVSPDGRSVVVMRNDPQNGNQDIWTYDLATGKGTAVTSDISPENAPIWSPDGKQIAYVSTRGNYASIYVKSADGTGGEEQMFRYTPGAGMVLTDWSADGKFMTFYTGVLLLVAVTNGQPALDRKAIEWLREDYDAVQGRFSPDGRFMAYLSNEAAIDRLEVYVRPFDASKPDAPPPGKPVQISKNGAIGMIFWRKDGKELLYMNRDWEVISVDVSTSPTFQAGPPKMLFKLQGPLPGNPAQWKNVSADAEKFVFAMPVK